MILIAFYDCHIHWPLLETDIYCIATEYKRFEINQSWVSLSPCVAFPLLSDISLLSTIVVAQTQHKKNSNCGVQVHGTML